MTWIRPLAELTPADAAWAGAKAVRLAELAAAGFTVPSGVVVHATAYRRFVEHTGLDRTIQLLLGRKRFEDMRWEEVWDLALRVRNRFARTPLPDALRAELEPALAGWVDERAMVVRSAGLSEDSATASFAGLHDSFVDVRGVEQVLEHIRLVWASLWSDRALLYRQELGLDPRSSRIAVIVQELVVGRASGVAFTRSPTDEDQAVVEAVWGLNQGLVDGTVPPCRWQVDRATGNVGTGRLADQERAVRPTGRGVRLVPLDAHQLGTAPLSDAEVHSLFRIARQVESLFGAPQDVEWTLSDGGFSVLQARPITTSASGEDARRWYLGLHRSIGNLEELRDRIRGEILPGMDRDAAAMASVDLGALDGAGLAEEIRRRRQVLDQWIAAYWRDCIPFAHGMRLFGQVYTDRVRPEDPFEFVELLRAGDLLAQRRNAEILALSRRLHELDAGGPAADRFRSELAQVLDRYGLGAAAAAGSEGLLALLSRLAEAEGRPREAQLAEERFLARFEGEERGVMSELLALARESYRLRDDDNIHLGRIESQLVAAVREADRRVGGATEASTGAVAELVHLLEDPSIAEHRDEAVAPAATTGRFEVRARQLVGQPAGLGLAVGPARVILDRSELLSFQQGEILVCDAIDPGMTFVAPLAAAVVERRGGMLIHGAIIAREYGIPCVTGVPEATRWIRTGDVITVDGHVGLVTVSTPAL